MGKDISSKQVEFRLKGLRLWMGLDVDEITIFAQDGQLTLKPFELQLPNGGTFAATIRDSAISAMLQQQAPPMLHDFEVRAVGGELLVSANAKLGLKIGIKAVAKLSIADPSRLDVVLVDMAKAPGPVRDLIAAQVAKTNPLLETSDWPMPLAFESVSCDKGIVEIRGAIKTCTVT